MTVMEVTALKAMGPYLGSRFMVVRGSSRSRESTTKTRSTARMGVRVHPFTGLRCLLYGKAPSRAMAKPMRLVTVRLLMPAKNRFTTRMSVRMRPILLPVATA